jgi:hypothetical protein
MPYPSPSPGITIGDFQNEPIEKRKTGILYNMKATIARITKIITSHFAMVIEKPAIPFAPSTNATSAKMRNNIANPIKSAIIHLLQ